MLGLKRSSRCLPPTSLLLALQSAQAQAQPSGDGGQSDSNGNQRPHHALLVRSLPQARAHLIHRRAVGRRIGTHVLQVLLQRRHALLGRPGRRLSCAGRLRSAGQRHILRRHRQSGGLQQSLGSSSFSRGAARTSPRTTGCVALMLFAVLAGVPIARVLPLSLRR